jgi:hypothetical protein
LTVEMYFLMAGRVVFARGLVKAPGPAEMMGSPPDGAIAQAMEDAERQSYALEAIILSIRPAQKRR